MATEEVMTAAQEVVPELPSSRVWLSKLNSKTHLCRARRSVPLVERKGGVGAH